MRRKEAGFYSAIALIMVGVLVLVSLPSRTVTSTESMSSETLECQDSAPALNGTGGYPDCLQLKVSVNSTILSAGQSLRMSVEVFNGFSYSNDVTDQYSYQTTDWQFGGFPVVVWSGCWYTEPLQFFVVQGNYSLATLFKSDPIVPPQDLCIEEGSVYSVVFQPNSDVASVTGGDCSYSCSRVLPPVTIPINATLTLNGYYNASDLTSSLNYGLNDVNKTIVPTGEIAFVPGVYTLAVSSEWGQAEVVQFTVN